MTWAYETRLEDLNLERVDGAADELWSIAQQYWDHKGFDRRGNPAWTWKGSQVFLAKLTGGPNVVAGAGGVLSLKDAICATCNGPLTLRSRDDCAVALKGGAVDCRSCSGTFEARVAAAVRPGALEAHRVALRERILREEQAAESARVQATERHRLEQEENAQREALNELHCFDDTTPLPDPYRLGLRDRIVALALTDHFSHNGIVGPVEPSSEGILLGPSNGDWHIPVASASGKYFHVSPHTPTSAFVWELRDDGWNFESFYPLQLWMGLGHPNHDQEMWDAARQSLSESIQPRNLTLAQQLQLADLAAELFAGEALRYFDHRLGEELRQMVIHPDHRARALELYARAAEALPLNQLYSVSWTVGRDVAEQKSKIPKMGSLSLSTYAVNRLATRLAQKQEPGAQWGREFSAVSAVPFTALTQTLFFDILTTNPMRSTVAEIRNRFPGPADDPRLDVCRVKVPDGLAAVDALLATWGQWGGDEFSEALREVTNLEPEICAPGCVHDQLPEVAEDAQRRFQSMARRAGQEAAALAVVEFSDLQNRDGVAGRPDDRTGDLLLSAIATQLGVYSDEDANVEF